MARTRKAPVGQPFVDPKTGHLIEPWLSWLMDLDDADRTGNTNVNSGLATLSENINDRINTEIAARISGDSANAGSGDGSGVTDSRVYSGKLSNGATWVTLATCMLTPSAAAGEYTFEFTGDLPLGHLDNEGSNPVSFLGNWRIVEEENGGGTPVTLASGTFQVDYAPSSIIEIEGPDDIILPEGWVAAFSGLPSSPIANNYDSIVVDLRFEIQRASGTNNIIASGLAGTFATTWAP